jgi:hypothetical protein
MPQICLIVYVNDCAIVAVALFESQFQRFV